MAVYYSTDNLPEFNNAIITIGTFDGVHTGHQTILKKVVAHAEHNNADSVLITFDPHPRKLVFPDQPIHILTPLEEKLELITAIGIKHIIVVPFTKEFAQLSAKEYVINFLVEKIKPSTIIIGYDHHFGNDRKGNIQLLQELKSEYNFNVVEIEAQLIEDAAISSTKVRNAVTEGKVSEASSMLGRNYTLTGTVIKGQQLGRTLGYPTANLQPANTEQIIAANGVYAVLVHHNHSSYKAMLNIGIRPTVSNELGLHIEANIFDFDKDIYDQTITLEFVDRIRDEVKFSSLDELKAQLQMDELKAKEILA